MIFTGSVYDKALLDLAAGTLTDATVIDALLLTSGYVFDRTDTVASAFVDEVADAGYARFDASAVFTIAQVDDEVQYQVLTPEPSFGPFSTADWRYVVLFNHASDAVYLCLDSGQANALAAASFTVDPGDEPYLRLVAP